MEEEEYTIEHTDQLVYVALPGGRKAYLKYRVEGNVMKLIQTYTPPEFRGRGIAAQLVKYSIDLARRNNWLIEPICSYAVYYFMKSPGERDVLVERFKRLSDDEWRQLLGGAP
ncbi:MAG: N-acetyltransferase [Candidatus Nezhaarchaeota archaeon]|nr:N-acetyltransferase [Candidatus Nezhaarchaeota archaeon]MCX8142608.1 N-acetyltransferase [Candidatus Nezhaarchaeota archaeon]